ncbi:hypothetical protein EDB84DRAFT_1557961 [Lactarius hengduanensis]|nr:hypothetical protein EDB84DRAFT_1557961 [Lactarius hengduanensis]
MTSLRMLLDLITTISQPDCVQDLNRRPRALSDLTIRTDLEKEQVNGYVKIHVEIVKATKVVTFNSPAELLDDAFTKHVVDVRRRATHKVYLLHIYVTPDVISQAQYALDTKTPALRDFGAGAMENWVDFVNDQRTAAALRLDAKLSSHLVEVAVPDAGPLNLVHAPGRERMCVPCSHSARHPEVYLKDLDEIVWYNDPDDEFFDVGTSERPSAGHSHHLRAFIRLYDSMAVEMDSHWRLEKLHRFPIHLMTYSDRFDCVISADEGSFVEYWTPGEQFELPTNVPGLRSFESPTGLYEFKKSASTVPATGPFDFGKTLGTIVKKYVPASICLFHH